MPEEVIEISSMSELPNAIAHVFKSVSDDFAGLDFQPALKQQVVPALAKAHEEYFNREAGPVGEWAPLAPATVEAKGFDTILIETNTMRSSLLFSGRTDHIEDISEAGLTWGTSDEKAAFHMSGTSRMPARPFVGMTDELTDDVAKILADAAVKGLKK